MNGNGEESTGQYLLSKCPYQKWWKDKEFIHTCLNPKGFCVNSLDSERLFVILLSKEAICELKSLGNSSQCLKLRMQIFLVEFGDAGTF